MGLDKHRQQALMHGGPARPTRAPGDVHAMYVRGFGAVVVSVARDAGRVERRQGRAEAQTLGGMPCPQTGACGYTILLERLPVTPHSAVREVCRGNPTWAYSAGDAWPSSPTPGRGRPARALRWARGETPVGCGPTPQDYLLLLTRPPGRFAQQPCLRCVDHRIVHHARPTSNRA